MTNCKICFPTVDSGDSCSCWLSGSAHIEETQSVVGEDESLHSPCCGNSEVAEDLGARIRETHRKPR